MVDSVGLACPIPGDYEELLRKLKMGLLRHVDEQIKVAQVLDSLTSMLRRQNDLIVTQAQGYCLAHTQGMLDAANLVAENGHPKSAALIRDFVQGK